jgi:hypothetical protein
VNTATALEIADIKKMAGALLGKAAAAPRPSQVFGDLL